MRNCKTFTLLTLLSLSTGCAEDVSGRDAKPTSDHETTLRALEKSASHTILAGDGVLEAGFHADAIHLFREENHLLTMRWAGVNKPPSTFAKARPVLEGEEIRYKRGAITEWYKPHANGIEQGLALEAAPEFEGQDAIRLTWCIAGAQDAELLEDGRALSLGTSNGQKLRVDKLAAWDSTGMRLRARFDLEAHNACEETSLTTSSSILTEPLSQSPSIPSFRLRTNPSSSMASEEHSRRTQQRWRGICS